MCYSQAGPGWGAKWSSFFVSRTSWSPTTSENKQSKAGWWVNVIELGSIGDMGHD